MILLTYLDGGSAKLGVKTENGVINVSAASGALQTVDIAPTAMDFYRQGSLLLPALQRLVGQVAEHPNASQFLLNEDDLTLSACVPHPQKILCVGLNYAKHAAEAGLAEPEYPVFFSKYNNAIAAPNEDIPVTEYLSEIDYEAELGVVIGKRAQDVAEGEALDYVLGYCNLNDLSERRLQMLTGQWMLGKTMDKFLPMGPYILTTDTIFDPQALRIRCWLNGELRQDSNTADMIFSVAEIVSFASRYMTLEPGDVISTGTPEGVIFGYDEKIWMKAGDSVTIQIGEGEFGSLTNKLA